MSYINLAQNRFLEGLRKEPGVKGPTSPSFDRLACEAIYSSIDTPTQEEKQAKEFAFWIDISIKALIQKWAASPLHKLPPERFIGLIVKTITSMLLRDALAAQRKATQINTGASASFQTSPLQIPIQLSSGLTLTTQELAESVMEALPNLIKHSIKSLQDANPLRDDLPPPADLDALALELLNIASAYRCLLDFWERVESRCWLVKREGDTWHLTIKAHTGHVIACSRHRKQSQDEHSTYQLSRRIMAGNLRVPHAPIIGAKDFTWNGASWNFSAIPMTDPNRITEESVVIYDNIHSWVEHLISKPLNGNKNVNGKIIFDALLVIRRLSLDFHEHCASQDRVEAPLIVTHSDLVTLFQRAISWSERQVNSVIPLITHDGILSDEFYGHPLIRLQDEKYLIFSPAAAAANMERVLDLAMKKHLSEDIYASKGTFYEQFIRDKLYQAQRDLHPSKGWWKVWPHSIDIKIDGNNNEIDLLLVVGSTLYVGEIKCSSHPFDPNELSQRLLLAQHAAAQAWSKVQYIKDNWGTFVKKTGRLLTGDISSYQLEPLVILNGSHSSGHPINGVPVTDIGLLASYLSGPSVAPLIMGKAGQINVGLHSDRASFERNLLTYLRQPPIIDLYRSQIQPRLLPNRNQALLGGDVYIHEYESKMGGNALDQAQHAAKKWKKRTSLPISVILPLTPRHAG